MSCNNNDNCVAPRGNGFIFVVVLYILLAIILGSCFNTCQY